MASRCPTDQPYEGMRHISLCLSYDTVEQATRSYDILRQDGEIFLTYAVFARGGEELLSTYMFLDLTPKGRNETGPNGDLTDWVRPHDRYDEGGSVNPLGQYQPLRGDCCASNT